MCVQSLCVLLLQLLKYSTMSLSAVPLTCGAWEPSHMPCECVHACMRHCLIFVADQSILNTIIFLVHTPSGWQGTPLSRVRPTRRPSSMYQWSIIRLMMRYSMMSLTWAKISSRSFLSRLLSESHTHTHTHAHTPMYMCSRYVCHTLQMSQSTHSIVLKANCF